VVDPFILQHTNVVWTAPRHRLCQNEVVADIRQRDRPWNRLAELVWTRSKHFFQLHGVNAAEEVVLRKRCGARRWWRVSRRLRRPVIGSKPAAHRTIGRGFLRSFGHEVN